ncbi:MAG: hypothetical protein IJ689_01660 [Alphaproteobacteria bacterium]|nr:hypothetical protein [Alphaproteobacteria bacterium]
MKKNFWKISLLLGAGVALCAVALIKKPQFYSLSPELSKVITEADSLEINDGLTAIKQDGIWCSRDDDCYPLNNDLTDKFIRELSHSALNALPYNKEIEGENSIILHSRNGEELKLLYDNDEGQTDEIIALQGDNGFELKGRFLIPAQPYQWFIQPLLPFDNEDIEEIYGAEPQDFDFKTLDFYQAVNQSDFDEWDKKDIRIVLKNGVVIAMELFNLGHSYWVKIDMSTTVMPSLSAEEYVKNNGFLYEGWYFELPQPVGSRLWKYNQSLAESSKSSSLE